METKQSIPKLFDKIDRPELNDLPQPYNTLGGNIKQIGSGEHRILTLSSNYCRALRLLAPLSQATYTFWMKVSGHGHTCKLTREGNVLRIRFLDLHHVEGGSLSALPIDIFWNMEVDLNNGETIFKNSSQANSWNICYVEPIIHLIFDILKGGDKSFISNSETKKKQWNTDPINTDQKEAHDLLATPDPSSLEKNDHDSPLNTILNLI